MNALPKSPLTAAPLLPFERPLPQPTLAEEQARRWVVALRSLQRSGAVLLAVLLLAICGVYWWTFQTQARWEEGYRQLTALRTQSRQIAVLNEALTGDLAGSVALRTPLRVATPSQAITVAPAVSRPLRPPALPNAGPAIIPAGY